MRNTVSFTIIAVVHCLTPTPRLSSFIEQIILALGKIRDLKFRPACRFRVGDTVKLKDGTGYPMLITEVQKTKQMKEPLLYCRWFDHQTKETRYNFFPESSLDRFDWGRR